MLERDIFLLEEGDKIAIENELIRLVKLIIDSMKIDDFIDLLIIHNILLKF